MFLRYVLKEVSTPPFPEEVISFVVKGEYLQVADILQ